MDEQTQKIIAEQMKIMPTDVKQAILSVDYNRKLEEITKRQRLLIDQAGKLEMETTLVLIGLEPLADYTNNLQRELGVSLIHAKEIAMDVSENIFKPIRDSLQKMNEVLEKPEEGLGEEEKKEADLNRDQILNEIENPILNRQTNITVQNTNQAETKIEIRPIQEVEIRPKQEINTIPGQTVQNIPADIVKSKMTETTITSHQIVEAKSETKLPEVTKRPYSSGNDPYREPIA